MVALSRCLSSLALFLGCADGARKVKRQGEMEDAIEKAACGFVTEPVQRDIGGGFRSYVWTEPYSANFFTDGLLLNDAAFQQYTNWLGEIIPRKFGGANPFNQRECLRNQRGIFKNVGFSTHAWDVILNGSVGSLSAANCIESALWAKQNQRYPLMVNGTEYGAYILVDSARTTVKVYLQTGPQLGVPSMSWAIRPISEDMNNGFQLLTFLHLHPFNAWNIRYQDYSGTCVPSDPDRNTFANGFAQNAREAWITNGHDSFRFPLSDLPIFNEGMRAFGHVEVPEVYLGEEPVH